MLQTFLLLVLLLQIVVLLVLLLLLLFVFLFLVVVAVADDVDDVDDVNRLADENGRSVPNADFLWVVFFLSCLTRSMLGTPIQIPLICVSRPQACVAAVMETNSKWWHMVFLSFLFTILVLQFF